MTDEGKEEKKEEEVELEAEVEQKPRNSGEVIDRWGGSIKVSQDEEAQGPALWLITFTDVMALMLTFFVMLYSMSVPQEEKWEEMTDAIDSSLSSIFQAPKWYQGPQDTISISKLDFSSALDLDYLKTLVEQIIEKDSSLKNVVVIPQKNKLVLSLPTDLLFESGQAEVTASGKRALFALGDPLSRIRNRIEIAGHADPRPLQGEGGRYKTNWELSLGRAANVASVLENVGYARSVVIRGSSSGRYDELSGDLSEDDRLSYARRVDIVIMKDDGSQRFFNTIQ